MTCGHVSQDGHICDRQSGHVGRHAEFGEAAKHLDDLRHPIHNATPSWPNIGNVR